MKSLILMLVALCSSTSFAAHGDVLLSCSAQSTRGPIVSTQWNVTDRELDTPKTIVVESEPIELSVHSLFGTTTVLMKIDNRDDEVVPVWSAGRSASLQLADGRAVEITCYYQHDDD